MDFSINTNILETNILNLAVVVGVLVYFGGDLLNQTLSSRQKMLSESLDLVMKRDESIKIRLAAIEKKRLTQQEGLETIVKHEFSEFFDSNKNLLVNEHSFELNRLTLTQAATLTMEQERVLSILTQKIKKQAIIEGSKKINKALNNNPHLDLCLINDAVPLIMKT